MTPQLGTVSGFRPADRMLYHSPYQLVIAALFAVAGGLCVVNRRADLLLALGIVSLGFENFWVYALSSVWLPIKIVGIWSVVYVFLVSRSLIGSAPSQLRTAFGFLCVFVLIGFAAGYLVPIPSAFSDTSGTQGAFLRPVVQLIGYVTAMSFVPLAFAASRFPNAASRMFGYYAAAVVVVSLVGLYQYIALKTGLGFMPIYRAIANNSDLAAFTAANETITRLYSLAGEPKSLGIFLTPFVVCGAVLSFESRAAFPVWWNRRLLFLFVGAIDVLTYSSAILIALGVAILGSTILAGRRANRYLKLAVVPLFLIAGIFQFWPASTQDTESRDRPGIEQLIYDRTVDRIEEVYQERNETRALELLYAEPLYLFSGVGLGMYVYHLPDLYFGRGIEPIDSGWVVSLMDLGLIGALTLFVFIYLAAALALSEAGRCGRVGSVELRMLATCVITTCAMQLGTSSLPSTMIWCGLAVAVASRQLNGRYARARRVLPFGRRPVRALGNTGRVAGAAGEAE